VCVGGGGLTKGWGGGRGRERVSRGRLAPSPRLQETKNDKHMYICSYLGEGAAAVRDADHKLGSDEDGTPLGGRGVGEGLAVTANSLIVLGREGEEVEKRKREGARWWAGCR
jgi:hypothetical protein